MSRQATVRCAAALTVGCAIVAMLASCTSPAQPISQASTLDRSGVQLVKQTPGGYTQCVPYARDYSGIQIYGDAWTWWSQASGRYPRGATPQRGSVLTLRKTQRLPSGHVAVVAAVIDSRRILVDHANWGDTTDTRGKVHVRQPVIDVSKKNDWSQVRFLNTQGSFGAIYPSYGFIYADSGTHVAQN